VKKLFYKLLAIIIFIIMVTSPFWSVVFVMEVEGRERPVYRGESWVDKQYYDALYKAAYRKVGLDDKF
jgi:hypothetical protein